MARGKSSRRRAKASAWRGTIRLGIVFVALIGLNTYFLWFRRGTSVPELRKLSGDKELASIRGAPRPARGREALEPPASPSPSASPSASVVAAGRGDPAGERLDEGHSVSGVMGEADTLEARLARAGVPDGTVTEVAAALDRADTPPVRAGDPFTLRFDLEERLVACEHVREGVTLLRVERTRNGPREAWRVIQEREPLAVRIAEVGGTLDASASLAAAVARAGEGAALSASLADLLAWRWNPHLDAQPGDHFRLVVEKLMLGERFWRYGRVLAVEYAGAAGTWRAFHHRADGTGEDAWYDERGDAIAQSLLSSPLAPVRLPPDFDHQRLRPVAHTELGNPGVDYGAPPGTPVWATAAGRVIARGERAGLGLGVVIEHPGGMETSYLRLGRLARGLEAGQTVRQKQVIGYVGNAGNGGNGGNAGGNRGTVGGGAGAAARPHLHFSVRMGGHFVDPLRLRPTREPSLPPAERAAFLAAIAPRRAALARIDVQPAGREVARAPARPTAPTGAGGKRGP